MTPSEVLEAARSAYNATGDDFFSDAELRRYVWAAQMELAKEGLLIEATYTTSTVASQQEYAFPTYTVAIKRITYDGKKLMPITFREDDTLTLTNQSTTATGTPQYYAIWDKVLYLRPVPAAVATLKIFSYSQPQEVTNSSALDIPVEFHLDLVDFLLWRMAIKDKNFQAANSYKALWDDKVAKARTFGRKARRGDAFTAVQDMDLLNETIIGVI